MIYWDYNATAPLHPHVREKVMAVMEDVPGNPSSVHHCGQKARAFIENVRRNAAEKLKVDPQELIFCSSATEANFLSLWGYCLSPERGKKNKIVCSELEHPSIRNNLQFLREAQSVELVEIPLKANGEVDLEALDKVLSDKDVFLCSLYAACNESGLIYPWQEISKLCRKHGVSYHCDMVQLIGREKFDLSDHSARPHSTTFAFHKSGGLKAISVLWIEKAAAWIPILRGGGQEKKRRAGTENIVGIASVEAFFDTLEASIQKHQSEVRSVRDEFEKQLKSRVPGCKIVGQEFSRLPNTTYCVFPGVQSDEMLMALDISEICASAGSACSSGLSEASAPLKAMGFSAEDSQSAIRFSLGDSSNKDQIEPVLAAIEKCIRRLKKESNLL